MSTVFCGIVDTRTGALRYSSAGHVPGIVVDAEGDAGAGKVELDYPTVRYVDYFTLLRINGEWKIVNKIFARFPRP